MGRAMLSGWLDSGMIGFHRGDRPPDHRQHCCGWHRRRWAGERGAGRAGAGILMLAVKPQIWTPFVGGLGGLVGPQTLTLSIAAGKTISLFRGASRRRGGAHHSHYAVDDRRGITGAVAIRPSAPRRSESPVALGLRPGRMGRGRGADRRHHGGVGQRPGLCFSILVECMAEAGRKCGLPADRRHAAWHARPYGGR